MNVELFEIVRIALQVLLLFFQLCVHASTTRSQGCFGLLDKKKKRNGHSRDEQIPFCYPL